jgi:uncharacterized RDD family membrane protein YckC
MLSRMNTPSEASDATPAGPRSAAPAHLGWRLLAIVYDLLPLVALWFATSLIVYLVRGEQEVRPGSLAAWIEFALLWLVTGAYFVASWSRVGASLGMRAWRLKALAADGRAASFRALCVRYLVATLSLFALGIGFLWSLIDAERRTWHDLASGTRFVRMDRDA